MEFHLPCASPPALVNLSISGNEWNRSAFSTMFQQPPSHWLLNSLIEYHQGIHCLWTFSSFWRFWGPWGGFYLAIIPISSVSLSFNSRAGSDRPQNTEIRELLLFTFMVMTLRILSIMGVFSLIGFLLMTKPGSVLLYRFQKLTFTAFVTKVSWRNKLSLAFSRSNGNIQWSSYAEAGKL